MPHSWVLATFAYLPKETEHISRPVKVLTPGTHWHSLVFACYLTWSFVQTDATTILFWWSIHWRFTLGCLEHHTNRNSVDARCVLALGLLLLRKIINDLYSNNLSPVCCEGRVIGVAFSKYRESRVKTHLSISYFPTPVFPPRQSSYFFWHDVGSVQKVKENTVRQKVMLVVQHWPTHLLSLYPCIQRRST